MGRVSKKKISSRKNAKKSQKNHGELFSEEPHEHINVPQQEIEDNLFDFGMVNYRINQSNFGCTTNVELRDASTQTSDIGTSNRLTIVMKKFDWNNIADLSSLLKDSIGSWNSINRKLSLIIYLILRILNVNFESTREILSNFRLIGIQRAMNGL
ncbi:unnamed protein product [Brachionus calyciflorus]|uniref:Uncharacterized protein n=1 Tax=Brachionus calyciflorus TaxID=104777 RepID=A0A813VU69_9BILA|nr:unnamed protein product [Brachionus calyciflorus]